MSALIYITTEYILIELAHIYVVSQNLHPSIFVPLLIMDINMCHLVFKSVSIIYYKCFNKIQVFIFFKCTVDNL